MKELLALLSLVAIGLAEEAPYAPSGWKPSGPAFELPQRQPQNTQQYLPPLDPRNPSLTPEDSDVSVQGLPTLEQQPIFQVSPINGQQYVGPAFNADIQALDDKYRQSQYQIQQEKAREFARQRALDAQSNNNRASNQQPPRQFVQTTTKSSENTNTTPKYNQEATTELNLNEGEALNDKKETEKVTVEVTKQKVQEFPPELFLSPLIQQNSQLIPLEQFARLTSPLYFQQLQDAQKSNQAVLAAAFLSQRQILQPNPEQNPVFLAPKDQASPVFVQAVNPQSIGQPAYNQAPLFTQPQAAFNQPMNQFSPGFNQFQPNVQYQPQFPVNGQYEPLVQPQVNQFPNQAQGNDQQEANNDEQNKDKPKFVYQQVYQQPQDIYQQPQQVYQQVDQQVYQQPQLIYQQPQQVNQQPQQVDQQVYPQPQLIYQQAEQVNQQPQQVDQQVYQHPQLFYQQPQQLNQQAQQVDQQVYQQPQLIYQQPQQVALQPQQVYQQPEQVDQPQLVYQQPQQIYQQVYQPNQDQFQSTQNLNQFYHLGQNQVQGSQDSLQSGINDQQGNDLDENEKDENENVDTNVSVATATAFGTRTQPRPLVRYGPPITPVQDISTTESQAEPITEQVPVIAEATAVANGRRKSAKLRSRRVRPVFTLDRSGHLVLAQEQ